MPYHLIFIAFAREQIVVLVVVGEFLFDGSIVAYLVQSLLSLGLMSDQAAEANRPVVVSNDGTPSPSVIPDNSVGAPDGQRR